MDKNKKRLKRFKRLGITALISLLLAIISFISFSSVFENNEELGAMFFGAGIVNALIFIISFLILTFLTRRYCNKCGSSLNGCDYSYRSVKTFITGTGNGPTDDRRKKMQVEITCVCPNCGNKVKYTKNFVIYDYEKGESFDPQTLVDQYVEELYQKEQ